MARFFPIRFRLPIVLALGVCALFLTFFLTLVFSSRARIAVVRMGLAAAGASVPRDAEGMTNLLLLGVGDKNHDGADLTDAMMLASIDPETRSAVLLSLPRDLIFDPSGKSGNGRINTVYAFAKQRLRLQKDLTEEEASRQALNATGEAMGEKLGVTIHGVFKADFTAFEEAVDALGGVDVLVEESIRDYNYPLAEDRVGLFAVDAGLRHFDGATALQYARSRHGSSDFDRARRQQQVLQALSEHARSLGRFGQFLVLPRLWNTLQGHVETTLATKQLFGLLPILSELSLDRVITMHINASSGGDASQASAGGFVTEAPPELYEGASVLLPLAPRGASYDWSQIRTFTAFLLTQRSVYLAQPAVTIVNVDASRLAAWRLRNEMLRYGWDVRRIVTLKAMDSFSGSLVGYRERRFAPSATVLGTLLRVPVMRMMEDESGSGEVVLILGSDFRYRSFQTLSGSILPL